MLQYECECACPKARTLFPYSVLTGMGDERGGGKGTGMGLGGSGMVLGKGREAGTEPGGMGDVLGGGKRSSEGNIVSADGKVRMIIGKKERPIREGIP